MPDTRCQSTRVPVISGGRTSLWTMGRVVEVLPVTADLEPGYVWIHTLEEVGPGGMLDVWFVWPAAALPPGDVRHVGAVQTGPGAVPMHVFAALPREAGR